MLGSGLVAAVLLQTLLGGFSPTGASTNTGWFALIVALMCIPFGGLLLALGVAKWLRNRRTCTQALTVCYAFQIDWRVNEHGKKRKQSHPFRECGQGPRIRSTAGGTMVANLTLATSDRQKDAQGNWQDRTEWHNLVAFKRTAEIVRDYVKKGSKLYIEGKIQTRSWDDKETGRKKYRTEIIVNELVAALRA